MRQRRLSSTSRQEVSALLLATKEQQKHSMAVTASAPNKQQKTKNDSASLHHCSRNGRVPMTTSAATSYKSLPLPGKRVAPHRTWATAVQSRVADRINARSCECFSVTDAKQRPPEQTSGRAETHTRLHKVFLPYCQLFLFENDGPIFEHVETRGNIRVSRSKRGAHALFFYSSTDGTRRRQ